MGRWCNFVKSSPNGSSSGVWFRFWMCRRWRKMRQESVGWCLVLLVVVQLALPALALPEGRKFAVKPNAHKKVITEKNEITVIILFEWDSNSISTCNFWIMDEFFVLFCFVLFCLKKKKWHLCFGFVKQPVESGFNWSSVLTTLFNMLFGTSSSIDKIDNGPHSQVGTRKSSLKHQSFLPPVLSRSDVAN